MRRLSFITATAATTAAVAAGATAGFPETTRAVHAVMKRTKSMPKGVTLPDGLKYVDLIVGTGPVPRPGQTVSVHYVGTLRDGTKFDSSRDRGQPFSFPVGAGRVIAGWDEGVATMRVGGRRKLIVPPALAYGEQGAGDKIPPNATLTFDIELLAVE